MEALVRDKGADGMVNEKAPHNGHNACHRGCLAHNQGGPASGPELRQLNSWLRLTETFFTVGLHHEGTRRSEDAENSEGQTPLWLALEGNHIDTVKALLAGGADVQLAGPGGATYLHQVAASKACERALRGEGGGEVVGRCCQCSFMAYQAVGLTSRGRSWQLFALCPWPGTLTHWLLLHLCTCLADSPQRQQKVTSEQPAYLRHSLNTHSAAVLPMPAAAAGSEAATALLLEAGASVVALDQERCTPLMVACKAGAWAVGRQLLAAGADVKAVGRNQWTALRPAESGGDSWAQALSLLNTISRQPQAEQGIPRLTALDAQTHHRPPTANPSLTWGQGQQGSRTGLATQDT
ncbi:ANK_REP_REGION domain-containing protein [Haematococcus lacustris]|uniref:ANK_REP_REGION domain-containing protein n=1 Tax=Haematococcus lacustris TaxID=44745 RepID=A0A699YR11_HAELA|nr:ANK_REP_REGION domain-containing protein [Haematococcus lacustris]